jgi:lipid A 4'-phosphatase
MQERRRRFRQLAFWPVLFAAGATVLISALLVMWPEIDQFAPRMFYAGNATFPARGMRVMRGLRSVGYAATYAVIIGLIAILVGKLVSHRLFRDVSWRVWWFLTLGIALGPGLIVNGVLKPLTNRPRPVQTDIFGGGQAFVPAWWPGNPGLGNGSFVSGEAAAAMYLVAFAFVVPKSWRQITAISALLWAAVISLNRIAFGAHYLSDILIAWGLTVTVILALRIALLSADNHVQAK